MPQATFFILQDSAADAALQLACRLTTQYFRQRQRILVHCGDQAQAEAFDELLWTLPVDAFVPHNLLGEGPASGTPVEITWQPPERVNRPILINLAPQYPDFAPRFQQSFDFVPAHEEQKQQARERYKYYRAAGIQLDTQPAQSINESYDG